jgi:predicted Zn finger-like uncharacterized protein
MSLITQCPACQTMFKVVADQLQVSQGWVRCGQCQNVFDANAYLYTQPMVEEEPAIDHARARHPAHEIATPPDGFLAEKESSTFSALDVDLSTQIPSAEHDAVNETFNVAPPVPEPIQSATQNLEVKHIALSFLPKHPKRVRRVSLWERAGMVLVILLLLGGLIVQFAAHERDLIAAHEPRLKPWLEDFCDAMKCRVRSLRQIDSVMIESSSFTKIRPDIFALNFSLKNTSGVPLAVPTIELSLTDAHDQALVRKVLREKDLNIYANTLAPGSQSNGSVMLSLASADMSERIAGYRILAFYP